MSSPLTRTGSRVLSFPPSSLQVLHLLAPRPATGRARISSAERASQVAPHRARPAGPVGHRARSGPETVATASGREHGSYRRRRAAPASVPTPQARRRGAVCSSQCVHQSVHRLRSSSVDDGVTAVPGVEAICAPGLGVEPIRTSPPYSRSLPGGLVDQIAGVVLRLIRTAAQSTPRSRWSAGGEMPERISSIGQEKATGSQNGSLREGVTAPATTDHRCHPVVVTQKPGRDGVPGPQRSPSA